MWKRASKRVGADQRGAFLSRLARDKRGNTFAIVGAAFIPVTAMVGSAIDVGRAYMAKARLQNACDASSLAARRALEGAGDTDYDRVAREAKKFFNFNFPQGSYETAPFLPKIARPDQSTIRISAKTTIPTSVMRIFGFKSLPLSVSCMATHNMTNTDVVLVLDVTGSMSQPVQGGSVPKIVELKGAVEALYNELLPVQTNLENHKLRLRYGIVPYSSAVNVGELIYQANPDYLVDQWTYQSRAPVLVNGAFSHWVHKPVRIDTSRYKTGQATQTPTLKPGVNGSSAWKGCIEERDTLNTITAASGIQVPPGALDLLLNFIPNDNNATKWRPMWPEVAYWRRSPNEDAYDGRDAEHEEADSDGASRVGNVACPAKAAPLRAWSREQLMSYINTLTPVGNTYHDIGMIWGGRLISPLGIFSANNPDTYNGMPVSRHIIYMTDGEIRTDRSAYTSYGVEGFEWRVGGPSGQNQTEIDARHEQRFRMACYAVKQMKVSVWVVGFAQALTPALAECASSPSQAATSANGEELRKKFKEIGQSISAMRLSE